jgi:ATP-dependent Lon protease
MVMDPKSESLNGMDVKPESKETPIPEELPILPLSGIVLFPQVIAPFMVAQENFVQLVDDAVLKDGLIGVVPNRKPDPEQDPTPESLHPVGTAGKVLKMMKLPTGGVSFLVQGLARVEVGEYTAREPYFRARVRRLEEVPSTGPDMEALVSGLRQVFQKTSELIPNFPSQVLITAMNISDPGQLSDFVASNLPLSLEEQVAVLQELDQRQRVRDVMVFVNREIQKQELQKKIQEEIAGEMNEEQRKHMLRQQLAKIQQELGEKDEKAEEIENLRSRIAEAGMPEEAEKAALKEVDRLRVMNPAAPDYNISRTYLDWLIELPWDKSTPDNLDVKKAQAILDEDHYDLEKVKKRILEFLAIRKLRQDMKGPILCLSGPPGVGKTSLGKSVARAMGRKFLRISLGGCGTKPRSGVTGGPTWGPCPGGSSRGYARPEQTIRCSSWTRSTRSAPISAETPPPPSWRCWTRNRTAPFRTITWRSPLTFPRSFSSPRPTCWKRSPTRSGTGWKC